jgi:hypothetical protein
MEVADFLPYSWGFYHWGTGNYLLSKLVEVFESRNKGNPTLFDLQESLRNEKMTSNRKAEWHDVLTSRIDSTLTAIGSVVATPDGYPIHELLDKSVVLELIGLRVADAKLLISWWMNYVLFYRRAQNHRGKLYHVNIFDEYHRLGSRQHEWSEMSKEMGDSIIERFVRESRDFGEGNVFAFQEISRIQHSVIENTELKICGNLSSWDDIEVAAGSMNLKDNEVTVLDKLKVGEFLVKKRGGTPFVLKVDLVNVTKDVDDAKLVERMRPLIEEMKSREPRERENSYLPEITDGELIGLQTIAKEPYKSKTGFYAMMALQGRAAAKIAITNSLVKKKLVTVEHVQLESPRPREFLIPTELGIKVMKARNIDTRRWYAISKVGFKHSVIKYFSAIKMGKFGKASFEVKLPGTHKQFDVYAEIEGKKVAVEVYASPAINVDNLESAIPKVDAVFIVCLTPTILYQIRSATDEKGISDNPKLRFYANPTSFFKDIEDRATLYHILSLNTTETNPILPNGVQNKENSP